MPPPRTDQFDRIGVVVHPRRELARVLATIREWAAGSGADVVQLRAPGQRREVAPPGEAAECDLVIALGGDGTTLAALHTAAAVGRPVLGVACGSLGALTAVTAERLSGALDRVAAGDWRARAVPALAVRHGAAVHKAVNDLVLVRRGAGQVSVEVIVDGERYVRYGGDGLVAGTPLGSSAYTLAAGGPMLAPGTMGLVVTPLAPHGGVCPPLVTAAGTRVDVTLDPGHSGARLEVDGQVRDELAPFEPAQLSLTFEATYAELVWLGEQESLIAGLRRRGLLVDGARVLARDARAAAAEAAKPAEKTQEGPAEGRRGAA